MAVKLSFKEEDFMKLYNKIRRVDFSPITGEYWNELKEIANQMLQLKPSD
jgi:hypothetical protein